MAWRMRSTSASTPSRGRRACAAHALAGDLTAPRAHAQMIADDLGQGPGAAVAALELPQQ